MFARTVGPGLVAAAVLTAAALSAGTASAQTPEQQWLTQYFAQYTYNGQTGQHAAHAEHEDWHNANNPAQANYGYNFLNFHRTYIGKYDTWRAGQGLNPIPIWNSAQPIPTEIPHPGRSTSNPNVPKPLCLTWTGGGASCNGYSRLQDFPSADALGRAIDSGWHGNVHCTIGGDMCSVHDAVNDPVFWRWHKFVDSIWREWEGCGTPSANQVVVYSESNYWGYCSVLSVGEFSTPSLLSVYNDSISSVRVGANVKVELWSESGFWGSSLITDSNQSGVGAMNDQTSSIRVRYRVNCPAPGPDQVNIYSESGYWGACSVLGPGSYSDPTAMGFPNDSLSSIWLGANKRAWLFSESGLWGTSLNVTSSMSYVGNTMNDQTSSITVYTP
jgi:hypothetical protein